MKKQIIICTTFVLAIILFSSCQKRVKHCESQGGRAEKACSTNIEFTVADNYFVKNTVKQLDNPKIETATDFEQIFGMATTMGDKGRPTPIDFTKQYVIAVVLPETNMATEVEPVSLQKDAGGSITLAYKVTVGEKRSFSIIPNFALVVNKKDDGKVMLKEVEVKR